MKIDSIIQPKEENEAKKEPVKKESKQNVFSENKINARQNARFTNLGLQDGVFNYVNRNSISINQGNFVNSLTNTQQLISNNIIDQKISLNSGQNLFNDRITRNNRKPDLFGRMGKGFSKKMGFNAQPKTSQSQSETMDILKDLKIE